MSDGLRDPDLPSGAVVEVDEETGEGIRNDGKRLKPAGKNPWYLLATVRGEQTGGRIDEELHARNRRIWNGWACSEMDEDARAVLAEKLDLPPEDLAPLDDAERTEIEARFRSVPGLKVAIPDPSKKIDFSDTHFPMTLGMGKCVLAENAWFRSATFSGTAWFRSATFSGTAWFRSATFSGYASFGSATFSGYASFGSATFSGDASFGSATFSGYASFGSATFSGYAWFRSATFSRIADFSNKAFEAQTVFREARFLGGVPKFYQRDLHQDTTFTTRDGYWPVITDGTAEDAKQAYTRLRQVMNDLQKPDDEHFFFRQEMRCKARLEGRFFRLVSKGFEVVSDYGHSIGRPLGWLAANMLWPVLGHAVVLQERGAGVLEAGFGLALVKGLGFSFANTFAFFGFGRKFFGDVYPGLDAVTALVAGSQTVLGFVLLFFLGLGLRNRFRLK